MPFDSEYYSLAIPLFLNGLLNTIVFCTIAIVIGLPLGVVVALMRLSRRWFFRLPALWFVEALRNIPFLILVFFIFAALPSLGFSGDPIQLGIFALTAYGVALFSESIRGAVLSVPRGQMQAARALGMPYLRSLWRIVFPQMLGYLFPTLTNQMIGQIKESALLSIVGVSELSLAADNIVGLTFVATKTYLILALFYWILTGAVARLMMKLENRFTLRARVPVPRIELAAIPTPR
jgi:His/Glu/Gln/Arg/opine family amino acid ABC transporter permease subunit